MKVSIVLRKAGLAVLGFVLNRYGRSENDIPPDAAEEVMEVPLLVVIPEDPKVREATLEGVPVVEYAPDSEGARAFMKLAEEVSRIAGFKARVMDDTGVHRYRRERKDDLNRRVWEIPIRKRVQSSLC